MLFLPLLLFIVPAFLGITLLAGWQVLEEKTIIALVGSVFGVALFVTVSYVTSLIMPVGMTLIFSLLMITLVGATIMLWKTNAWNYWRRCSFDQMAVIIFALTFLLFGIIAPKLLIQKNGGLYTGIINAYGDVAWHASNITMFAGGQTIPPTDPIFAGTRLNYPFLINFLSAQLLVSGASLPQSFTLPAVILIPLLLTLLYCFVRELTGTKKAAIIALLLFLFGGAAFGWVRFDTDWQVSGRSLTDFLFHLPNRDYSGVGTDTDGFHFLNPVTSLLLPQRSFLIGLPLAMSIVVLLAARRHKYYYLTAGILAGLLPLWHAHTVLALIPVIMALFWISPGRQWLWFIVPAGIIGLPEIAYYALASSESGSFLRWGPGWMAGQENIVWYWLKNNGVLLPVVVWGLWRPSNKQLKALAIAGLVIFFTANLWLFAPWAWDNFKLFIYWLVFALPLVSLVAAQLLSARKNWLVPAAVIVVIGFHILAGSLDIWKLALPTATTWLEWDNNQTAFAKEIARVTKPGESIVTAPIHNSPVALAGRPSYLGYAAHVWSHGGNPWVREKAIQPFYEGQLSQLPEITPDYILVSPVERSKYAVVIQPAWQLVAQQGEFSLYRLP